MERKIFWLIVYMIFAYMCLWIIGDRVTRLEALVKLLEKEIIAIHKNEEA